MPDENIPFRARVKRAFAEALAEITPAAGYLSDLSPFVHADGGAAKRVFRGRAMFGDSDPLPMAVILERPEPAEELSDPPILAKRQSYVWNLVVQGFTENDGKDETDEADLLLADVKRRLAIERDRKDSNGKLPDPFGLGGKREHNRLEELSFGAGIVRPPDEISARSYFWLGVSLKLIEDPLFPFA